MQLFEYPELAITQIALLLISVRWLFKRNDEIPLLVSTFIFYVTSYRYWVINTGLNNWVNVAGVITSEEANKALACVVLGEICLLVTYMLFQKQKIPLAVISESDRLLLRWLRPKAIFLGFLCLPLVIFARSNVLNQVRGGKSLAFEVSGYLYLFPMVLVGIAVLIIVLWKFAGLTNFWTKTGAILILLGVVNLTFRPSSRFQFLGWMTASGIILVSSYKPKKRLMMLFITSVVGLGLFAIAGTMRNTQIANESINQQALVRASGAEDANMLDGFVILQKVYPQELDFRWGMVHLEVLLRPIPRSLWPDKPVGGLYSFYLGLSDADKGTTLGFSPTLFGSFYAEAGILGIVILSIIYGSVLAKIITYSTKIRAFAGVLVRAIVCAALIPLLRGGDLAGIYAWFGMAFWPCFLLLWLKRVELKLQFASPSANNKYHHVP
ncbi:MAG: hypothetical protein F6K61_11085 [Sphaerospermopsis sp. SIO1G1]|nr:hypothetical protein [Sphaerospermopsis sp. SIO1G1]